MISTLLPAAILTLQPKLQDMSLFRTRRVRDAKEQANVCKYIICKVMNHLLLSRDGYAVSL